MKKNAINPGVIINVSLLLHNIRSVHNVGSIFRTADAFGVKKIYLSGYTPAPVDRFGRARADLAKVSLGAEKTVAWEQVGDAVDFIQKIKNITKIIALEQDEQSVDYRTLEISEVSKIQSSKVENISVLLILGNEVGGIEKEILDLADEIVEIPMRGQKESLNVSVAVGIALFGLF